MKTTLPIALLLMAAACPAQQSNPFVQKGETKKEEPPVGPSYVGIIEQILVPPELIEAWLLKNGVPDDATALRAIVQDWIRDGKASCDHTSIGIGVTGRNALNESVLEQIYPTEYAPNGSGVWPLPTSFETRNLGYTMEFKPSTEGGKPFLTASGECVEMIGSNMWNPLMEKTRHPDDVFMPVIRSVRLSEGQWAGNSISEDPFAEASPPDADRRKSVLTPAAKPGAVALVSRVDPLPTERKAGDRSRLVFFRGAVEEEVRKAAPLPPRLHVSYKSVNVPHAAFSEWLQGRAPLDVPASAWSFVESLKGDQAPTLLEAADGIFQSDAAWTLENIREVIYPTEWEPNNVTTLMERWEAPKEKNEGGKSVTGTGTMGRYKIQAASGLAGASLPTSFETRNTGVTLEMKVSRGTDDPWIQLSFSRVDQVGESVYRRIEDNGNWIPDMKLPLFASNRSTTACRLERGRWTLVSSGTEFNGPGKADREHCLLMFIKVE
jgi:hypothetical protein